MELVDLDGTDEYLTGISGFYGPIEGYNGLEGITSITFHTNKMTRGPYGRKAEQDGEPNTLIDALLSFLFFLSLQDHHHSVEKGSRYC
ncbi:hypothetical protein L6452_34058 [Arctium lappa]|uniref:Uncharacterized protein n=1 Tax=Arctium lappa TaxID=4217 RepID=A0ACB8YH99_ARCLA|nr:hypothetical protein L6452_34058 [Arctium lappa]